MNELLAFIHLFHLDDVFMADEADDLNFFPQEIFFSLRKRRLVDLFHGDYVLGVLILALVHGRELAVAQFAALNISFLEAEVVGLLPHVPNPVLNDLLVHVKQLAGFDCLILMRKVEAEKLRPLLRVNCVDI